jgi:IS605 OrfB family transposase
MQKFIQRTVSVKIDVPEGFLDFMETCNQIANDHIEWSFSKKTYNKSKAHQDLYLLLRETYPTIPSGLIQTIRDVSLESVKRDKFKFKPTKKPHSGIRYDRRTMSLRGNKLTFSWSGDKRVECIVNIPVYFQKYLGWKFQGATICYNRLEKRFKANLTFKCKMPDKVISSRIVGVDRGLYNIVSLSDGQLYNARLVRKNKRRFLFVKRQLQAKGTPSAKRKLKKRSGKEKRFSLQVNHCISKWLVNQPYDIFVLEDLTGIRNRNKGRKLNGWLSNWTFHQLETFLIYKAEGLGKQVVKVDAYMTSQICSNCGISERSNRNKSKYSCSKCGHQEHADINAAINIKTKYILSLTEKNNEQVVVNQPIVSMVSESGTSDTTSNL